MLLRGDARLLGAGRARRPCFEFGSLEGAPSAMRAKRARTKRSGLLGLLRPFAQMAVGFLLDAARIGRPLRPHAAFHQRGWNSSARKRSPVVPPPTSRCSSTL